MYDNPLQRRRSCVELGGDGGKCRLHREEIELDGEHPHCGRQ
jgi:hypothetical protein